MTRPGAEARGRSAVVPYGLALGFLVGVLIAALALPEKGRQVVTAGRGAGGSAGVDPGDAAAGAGIASGIEGQAAAGPGTPGAATRGASGALAPSAGQAGRRAAAAAAAAAQAAAPRGVTDSSIKVGIAILELGALRALGPAFDNGDRRAHFEAILAAWKREGRVPVHGRNVEFVYRSYGPTSPTEQRAACAGLVQDEKVFAVMADSQFNAGIECVAREYRTPIITSDAPDDTVFARGAPFIFTLQMSQSRMFRNLVHWADRRGSLRGKKIGLYYLNDPVIHEVVNRNIKAELSRLGYSIAADATTDQPLGGPGDSLAVQKFRAAGVDLAILLTSKAGFMQQAEAQAYRPSYLESDYLSGTTNTATSTYPPEHFDGTFGITGMRFGEWKANLPAPPEAQDCVADYERASGRRVEPNAREAEYIALTKGCDDARVFIDALHRAGRELSAVGAARTMEATKDAPMAIHGRVTFGADKHHGVDQQRTVKWSVDCRCWRALGDFAPLFVP